MNKIIDYATAKERTFFQKDFDRMRVEEFKKIKKSMQKKSLIYKVFYNLYITPSWLKE